jgi:hypothetical protein
MFYILFFTLCSFLFLLNLRYNFNYLYISFNTILDYIFLCVIFYLFNAPLFLILIPILINFFK